MVDQSAGHWVVWMVVLWVAGLAEHLVAKWVFLMADQSVVSMVEKMVALTDGLKVVHWVGQKAGRWVASTVG